MSNEAQPEAPEHDFVSREDLKKALQDAVKKGYELGYEKGNAAGRREENEACAVLAQRELLVNMNKVNLIGTLPAMIRSRMKA